jgi:hypothetical protein
VVFVVPAVTSGQDVSDLGSAAVRRRIAGLVQDNLGRFLAGGAFLHRVA